MRSLNEGEAAAIRSLLAALPVSESKRAVDAGLGSRTFQRIRKRAYESGWVFDRMIPSPLAFGMNNVHFVLVQPYAEDIEGLQARWRSLSSNVVLWRWPETLFGVFFSTEPRPRFIEFLGSPKGRAPPFVVSADSRGPSVPIYFDFEAAWVRFSRQQGSLAYPHPLPTGLEAVVQPGKSPRIANEAAKLLARPFLGRESNSPLHVSPFFVPRSQQALLSSRVVEWRTILDPKKVPSFQGRSIERVAFVQGDLVETGGEPDLFRLLMAIGVTPFLFASDGVRVLLAALSPAPLDSKSKTSSPATLLNLNSALKEIQIVREPVDSMQVVVNHRYDRLFHTPP